METFRGVVYPARCDAMGHLNVKEYMGFFDQAAWHCVLALGFDPSEVRDRGIGWADVKHTISYKRECRAGDLIRISSEVIEVGTKSLTMRHLLFNAFDEQLCAELSGVAVQYDLNARRAIPLLEHVRKNTFVQLNTKAV